MLILYIFFVFMCTWRVRAITRTYYVAAVEEDWNYAPQGNLVNDDNQTSDKYLASRADRIGRTYKKVLYREFTNSTFTQRINDQADQNWKGLLGPIFRMEVGDTVVIIFKNLAYTANRNFSVHPHGVQYNKSAEGALYVDHTTGNDKKDEGVGPGQTFTYVWRALRSFAPTSEDENCLPYGYHSHVAATKDVDSGLVGLMLLCKEGTLWSKGPKKDLRRDVDKELVLYVDTTDENESWLKSHNLNRCGQPELCRQLSEANDAAFTESNTMSHINGRMYGNLEDLTLPEDGNTVVYMFSLNRQITSISFSGQVLHRNNHRVNAVTLWPATFTAIRIRPPYRGNWLVYSNIAETYMAGQQVFMRVVGGNQISSRERRHAVPSTQAQQNQPSAISDQNRLLLGNHEASGLAAFAIANRKWNYPIFNRRRKYYLAIEKFAWDYGPSGQDLYNGGSLTASNSYAATFFAKGNHSIGSQYIKAHFVEYTDATFSKKKPRVSCEDHLGFFGPVLTVEEGEKIEIHLKNNADRPYSFLAHGLHFTKDNEGFLYKDPDTGELDGLVTQVNDTTVYRFEAPAPRYGLTRDDLPCITFMYQSAVDFVKDTHTGLRGPLMICKRGQFNKSYNLPCGSVPSWLTSIFPIKNTWVNSRRHIFLDFATINENWSWYLQENIDKFTVDPAGVNRADAGFVLANRKHSINGRMFANLEGISVCRNEDIAWHMFGVGGQYDMHGVNFQGQTLDVGGNHVEAGIVIPGSSLTMTSTPDRIGNWSIACRTNYHFLTGMVAKYEVKSCSNRDKVKPPAPPVSRIRRYYLAAKEILWDYAPLKRDIVTGENFTDDSQKGYLYVKDTDEFVGSIYKKAVFREYTDETFSTQKERGPEYEHLGILGPLIKAEVGDKIQVVFRNMASRPYSVHPQGVRYDKDNEGAKYMDGTSPTGGDEVAPAATYTYNWDVPLSAGPGENDPNCIAWMYYSSVNSVFDMNSGLVGPLLICKKGILKAEPGAPRRDVDREFSTLYTVFDENFSWYFNSNVADRAPRRNNTMDPVFQESNRKYTINGLIYGNVQGLIMRIGEKIAWYIMGVGSYLDFHPAHFHGQTFIHQTDRTQRGDVIEVFPSTSATVLMIADNPGTWFVHCHYSQHAAGGMEAVYTILP